MEQIPSFEYVFFMVKTDSYVPGSQPRLPGFTFVPLLPVCYTTAGVSSDKCQLNDVAALPRGKGRHGQLGLRAAGPGSCPPHYHQLIPLFYLCLGFLLFLPVPSPSLPEQISIHCFHHFKIDPYYPTLCIHMANLQIFFTTQ